MSHVINPVPSHKTHKSTTLMRTTVRKPTPIKTKPVGASPSTPQPAKVQKFSSVPNEKLQRAQAVPKSTMIQRFSSQVSLAPAQPHKAATVPLLSTSRVHAVATAHTVPFSPLDRALDEAESHTQPKAKAERRHVRMARRLKISPRLVSAGSLALAALLIGGFFAHQNIPNLNMRLASARANVRGSLPDYQPAGFRMNGGISYKPGEIAVSYKSNTDERNFKLTQASSSWNSETLQDNYLTSNQKEYQVVADKGKTIYLYDGSNATWVDGGIWYRIEGNSQLNSDQLLSIANSL